MESEILFGGGGATAGAGLVAILKYLHSRISKVEESKVDKGSCETLHEQNKKDIADNNNQYKHINQKIDTLRESMVRVETKLEMLVKE